MEGGRVILAEGDVDGIEGRVFWWLPLFDGREAAMAEEVVCAIQGTGVQSRGCGVDAKGQQQRVFNGKPKDTLLDETSTATTHSFSGSGHSRHVVLVTCQAVADTRVGDLGREACSGLLGDAGGLL